MVACDFWSHLTSSRECLQRLRVELLVKIALSLEEVQKRQSRKIIKVCWLENTRTSIIEDGGRKVAEKQKGLRALYVEMDLFRLQVDALVKAKDGSLVVTLLQEVKTPGVTEK